MFHLHRTRADICTFMSEVFSLIRKDGPVHREDGSTSVEATAVTAQVMWDWWAYTSQYWPLSSEELAELKKVSDCSTVPRTKYGIVSSDTTKPWGIPLPPPFGGTETVYSFNCRTM